MRPEFSPETLAGNLARLHAPPVLARQLAELPAGDVILEAGDPQRPRLTAGGRDLHHPDAPVEQAAREIAGFLADRQPDVVVFFGLGMGLHASFLEQQTDVPVLIYEPRLEVLAEVLPRIHMDLERATLVTNPGHLVEATVPHLSATRHEVAAGAIPAYRELFPADFEDFREALNQALKRIEIDQNTKALFADHWVDHLRDNLPILARSPLVAAMPPVFAGRPGILVGAGPSLDDNIEELKRVADGGLICAVHTAVQPLAKLGIVPHLATILEGHKLDYFFTDVPELDRIYLAADHHTHPCHLELGFKGLLPLNLAGRSVSDWTEQAHGLAPLPSGGSVACAAFSVLHHLGCDPIILVGMDAAFTHGRTHSLHSEAGCCRVDYDPETRAISYTYLDGRKQDGRWAGAEVTAWGGQGTVPTRSVYSSFRFWFEAAGQTWAGDRQLINATEGGARFQGFREMSLAEALAAHCPQPFGAADLLERTVRETPARDISSLGRVLARELEVVGAADQAAAQVLETGERVLKLLRGRQLDRVQPLLDRLSRSEKTLQEQTLKTRLLNSLIGHKVMALSRRPAPAQDTVSRTIHSVELSLEIAGLVRDGGRDLLEKFAPLAEDFGGGERDLFQN